MSDDQDIDVDEGAMVEAAPPPPIPATVPKRDRTRLAKAEVYGWLAGVANAAMDRTGQLDLEPVEPTPALDVRRICITYGLAPDDVARILEGVRDTLQLDATHRGWHRRWTQ